MKSLEQIAKQMFQDFAMRRTGMYLDWNYLSGDRRLQWMTEVMETFDECLKHLKTDLKINITSAGAASYERGFTAGQLHESNRLYQRIEHIKNKMKDELADFVSREAAKNVGK